MANPFKQPVSSNPFKQYYEDNPFARPLSEGNPFAPKEQEEQSYGIKMRKRIQAGWEEQAGGTIAATARGLRTPQTFADRVKKEAEEIQMRDLSLGEFARASAETLKLPFDVAFGAPVEEAAQGVVDLLPGETRDNFLDEMEVIGEDMFSRGEDRRTEAGEFDIRRPEGFEVKQGIKYYGTQALESLGANMAPAMAAGFLTRGRVNSLNNVLQRNGIKSVDADAMTQISGLGVMGTGVFGSEYERAFRESGGDHEFAVEQGTVRFFAEVVPEVIPFGFAMKVAGPLASAIQKMGGFKAAAAQISGGVLSEGASEVLTEIINATYDTLGLGKELKYDEFKAQMTDAFMVGALMGGVMNVPAAVGEIMSGQEESPGINRPDLGRQLDQNPQGGGFDLNTMGQINTTVDMGQMDLNQPIQYVEAEDGTKLEPLDLNQPDQFEGEIGNPTDSIDAGSGPIDPAVAPTDAPNMGIPVPDGAVAGDPFQETDAPPPPSVSPDNPFRVLSDLEPAMPEEQAPVAEGPRDPASLSYDDLQTDDEFNSWLDTTLAPERRKLAEMRYETPEQLAEQAKRREENKNADKTPGYNINPAKDNLLTVIAKHGGLETDSWSSEHGIDIKGVREKGGANWLAGAAQPLFSKYAKAMKPDDLAEFINQSGPETYGIPDEYLDTDGQVTATTVGNLMNDMIAEPDRFGGPEYQRAREFEAQIARTESEYLLDWETRKEHKAWQQKFKDGAPEVFAEMETQDTHDATFYSASWDHESRKLSEWIAEAADLGATDIEIEAATKGKDNAAKVKAIYNLIQVKFDESIAEQVEATFGERNPDARSPETEGGDQGETQRTEEQEQPPNPLTADQLNAAKAGDSIAVNTPDVAGLNEAEAQLSAAGFVRVEATSTPYHAQHGTFFVNLNTSVAAYAVQQWSGNKINFVAAEQWQIDKAKKQAPPPNPLTEDVSKEQAIADAKRKKDAERNGGDEDVAPPGTGGGLFSEADQSSEDLFPDSTMAGEQETDTAESAKPWADVDFSKWGNAETYLKPVLSNDTLAGLAWDMLHHSGIALWNGNTALVSTHKAIEEGRIEDAVEHLENAQYYARKSNRNDLVERIEQYILELRPSIASTDPHVESRDKVRSALAMVKHQVGVGSAFAKQQASRTADALQKTLDELGKGKDANLDEVRRTLKLAHIDAKGFKNVAPLRNEIKRIRDLFSSTADSSVQSVTETETEGKDWETVEQLTERFQTQPPIGIYHLKVRGNVGVQRADEALSKAGFVEIPFGKSTIFVHPAKGWTAFSRSQGDLSGVLVQYGKAKPAQIKAAEAAQAQDLLTQPKENDDGVSREESSSGREQGQDAEGQLPTEPGQQPQAGTGSEAAGSSEEGLTETGEGEATPPQASRELALQYYNEERNKAGKNGGGWDVSLAQATLKNRMRAAVNSGEMTPEAARTIVDAFLNESKWIAEQLGASPTNIEATGVILDAMLNLREKRTADTDTPPQASLEPIERLRVTIDHLKQGNASEDAIHWARQGLKALIDGKSVAHKYITQASRYAQRKHGPLSEVLDEIAEAVKPSATKAAEKQQRKLDLVTQQGRAVSKLMYEITGINTLDGASNTYEVAEGIDPGAALEQAGWTKTGDNAYLSNVHMFQNHYHTAKVDGQKITVTRGTDLKDIPKPAENVFEHNRLALSYYLSRPNTEDMAPGVADVLQADKLTSNGMQYDVTENTIEGTKLPYALASIVRDNKSGGTNPKKVVDGALGKARKDKGKPLTIREAAKIVREVLNRGNAAEKQANAKLDTTDPVMWKAGENQNPANQKQKLENTGADLRRWWEQLQSDLEASKSDGEKAWGLVNARTQRAKLFNPVPGADATPGVQTYYNEIQSTLYTFSEMIEYAWSLDSTKGRYGTPVGDQVAKRIQNKYDEWNTTASLTDLAREYETMIRRFAEALSGANSVQEAEKLVNEIIDVANSKRWSDPVYKDETFLLTVPARTLTDGGPIKKGPFNGGQYSKWVIDRSKSSETEVYSREYNFKTQETTELKKPANIPVSLWKLINSQEIAVETTSNRKKSAHNRMRFSHIERTVEKTVRDGNKTPQQMKEEFGLADVGFGKYVLKGADQGHLNHAWDAFADLADHLGIPHKAIGFYGKMHFTIGALGHGKYAAHFAKSQPHPEGGTVPVINVTNTKGDGSVAHEWGHALDHLGDSDTRYVVNVIKRELAANRSMDNLRAKVRSGIRGNVHMQRSGPKGSLQNVQALCRYYMNGRGSIATSFKKEADKLGKNYWGTDVEMFARAWEAYIFDTLDGENNYLVSDWVREGGVGRHNGYKGAPYPAAPERGNFAKLFDAMIKALETKDGKFGINREKFDAALPDEVRDYQVEAQKVYDSIPEMIEEYKAEQEAERQAKNEAAQQAEAEKWQQAREEAAAKERLRQEEEATKRAEQAEAEAAGDIASGVAADQPLTEDQLESLFDQALEQVQAEQVEKPEVPQIRTLENKDEEPEPGTPAPAGPKGGKARVSAALKEATELGVDGMGDVLEGLSKLFPPNKLHSFPPGIDEQTYNAAKPYFAAGLNKFQQAGKTLVELFAYLIKHYGAAMRPYLIHWAKTEGLSNNLNSTVAPTAPDLPKGSLAEFLETQDMYDITNNLHLKAALQSFYGRQPTETEIKAGQEALELVLVRKARNIVQTGKTRQEVFSALLEIYESQPNLNSRSSTSMENQAYSTPLPLAYLASELSGINTGTTVYEPTAGNGALLIGANPAKTVANELNSDRAQNLRKLGFAVEEHDATAWRPGSTYDAAIMNPPFGSLDKAVRVNDYVISKIDHHIVTKALENLNDAGRATLIIGANMEAGKVDQKTKIFLNWLYAHYNVIDHFEASGDLYRKQGASWPVAVITINGRKVSGQVFDRDVKRYSTWSEINEHVTSVLGSKEFTGRATNSTVDTGISTEDTATTLQPAGSTTDNTGRGSSTKPGSEGTGRTGISDSTGSDVVSGQSERPKRDRADSDGKRSSGERLPAREQSGVGGQAARPSDTLPGSKSARPTDKSNDELASGSDYQAPYRPGSKGLNEAVLMPVNMRTAIETAMRHIQDEVGDIDAYVMKKLGYKSESELFDSFMALQVDSVAAMIYNLEANNRGSIVADQTGVGKGRQAAAMIRYALRNNMVPVFVTAKANLFTDMYDDMLDIGETGAKPFIFNADGGFIVDREGGKHKFKSKPAARKAGMEALLQGNMPKGANMLMLTYDQINSNDSRRLQRPALEALKASGKKPMFIFDESHNIAGAREKWNSAKKENLPTTAGWSMKLIEDQPVMYLSATYAKRPDNMPIYYRTDLVDAVDDIDQLEAAILAGGEPLQTVVANMLAQAGQLWRRERSFEGIEFKTVTFGYDNDGNALPEKAQEREEHIKLTDVATKGLREIVSVDKIVSEWLKDNGQTLVKELIGDVGGTMENPGAMMEALMMHSPFTSRVHNFTKQLLLSMKADWIVEEAIKLHKSGVKPVIALDNTMESFLKAEIKRGNAEIGKPWKGDYRSILQAALATTRRVTLTNKQGKKERVVVPVHLLPLNLQELYARTEKIIDGLPLQDVVLFYIDYIRNKLEDAGIVTGEITGRNLMVDYSENEPTVKQRPDGSKKLRRETIDKFNSGTVDALILNSAGSTGLSIHASEKFKNKDGSPQKPRHMLVAQAMPDINILMQMFGRINRTGQIQTPQYSMLGLDLPSEQRPLAMTVRKMRSLNANTSANTESETSLNVAAILNKHGDHVIKELLLANPEWQTLTSYDVKEDTATDGMALAFTGKLALAPHKDQVEIWAEFQREYSEYVEYLTATNQNDLQTETIDLDARIIENRVIYEGKNPDSLFGGNTVLHKITAKVQGRPPSAYEMTEAVTAGLNGGLLTPGEVANSLSDTLDADTTIHDLQSARDDKITQARAATEAGDEKARTAAMEEADKLRAKWKAEEDALQLMKENIRTYSVGSAWKIDLGDDVVTGVVTDVTHVHNGKGSPFSPSKLKIKFMVNSAARQITLPLSKILKGEVIEKRLYTSSPAALSNLFDSRAGTSARETRYIATGNLLGGWSSLESGGRVVSFTAANGQAYSGILMPKKFGNKGEFERSEDQEVVVRNPAEVSAYLRATRENHNVRNFGVFSMPGQEVRILPSRWGNRFTVSVLRKKSSTSDKIKFDKTLHKLMGAEFVGRTQVLSVDIEDSQLDAVVKRITELTTLYIPGSGLKILQSITGRASAEAAISFDGSNENDERLRETFKDADEGGLFDNSNNPNAPKFDLAAGFSFDLSDKPSQSTGKQTFLSKQLEAAMARFSGRTVEPGTFTQIETPSSQENTVRAIERVFGRRVVFFRKNRPFPIKFNGVMLPRDPKTLYVNIDSRNPFAGVIGHELLHSIRRTHPDLYNKLAAIAKSRLKGDGFDRFSGTLVDQTLTADKMFEELMANLVGDSLLDPDFIAELAREGRTFWEQLWNAILDTLKLFQKRMNVRGMGSTHYFNHLDKLISEVQTTLKNYRPNMPPVLSQFTEPATDDQPSFAQPPQTPQTPPTPQPSFVKRIMSVMGHTKTELSDSIQLGLFDKFYGIKRAEREYLTGPLAADDSGYIAARFSTGAASAMRHLLMHGALQYHGGVIEPVRGSQGLLDVFAPVNGTIDNAFTAIQGRFMKRAGMKADSKEEIDRFLGWMIARRADRLYAEGKENNFTRDEIDAGLEFTQGDIEFNGQTRSREDVYEEVAENFAEFKSSVLDLAESAGLIDAVTRPVWDKADWIPFYRVSQSRDGKEGGVKFGSGMGLSHQNSGIRKLIGGSEELSDPLGNIIMNFTHLVTASMKNIALLKTVDTLNGTPAIKKRGYAFKPARIPRSEVKKMMIADGIDEATIELLDDESGGEIFEGIARMWQLAEPSGKEAVKVMRDGKPEFYTVNDPMLLQSLTNVDIESLGGLFKPLRAAKTLLTSMVTAEPSFMARNFMRDALSAWVISEDHFIPLKDSGRGLVKSWTEQGGMLHMMAAGGSFQGGYINGTNPEAARKSIRSALRAKGYSNEYVQEHLDSIIDFTAGTWDKWRRVGDAVENANREAVYEAAIKAGKSKSQAIFEAKDLMDFSMHGSWKAVQMLNDMLPFFNARLQGLYKLGRSGAVPLPGLIAKEIAMKGLWLAMFSVGLAWLNDDDDDYNALEDWDKDTYWHFFPGTAYHIRVPKPFEVGILYGTIPERMFRLAMGDDTPEKFFDRMGHAFMDTMAFDPIPQLAKPATEVWANRSSFTKRPIEGMGDERKLPRDRYNSQTSETMVAMGPMLEKVGLSPKQGEFLLRGYTGTLGSYALMAADLVVRDIMGEPAMPAAKASDLPVLKSFYRGSGPAYNTRFGTELYDMHREVTLLWGSVQMYRKDGQADRMQEIREDTEIKNKLNTRKGLASWAKRRSDMRKKLDSIYRSEDMTPDQKREAMDKLLTQRNELDARAYKYFSPMFDRK